jgi:malonyl-CoA O-methyltransferase
MTQHINNKAAMVTINQAPAADIEKKSIARRFGASAASYYCGAALQRNVGNNLLELMAKNHDVLLDLGAGPGHFSRPLQQRCRQLIGIDIAPPMLEFARQKNSMLDAYWVAGDAERLPLVSNTLDGIFSSLMLQWTHNLAQALKEAKRVLKPGAQLVMSTLIDGTLAELAQAWSQVDNHQHVNSFMTQAELERIIAISGFKVNSFEVMPTVVWYDDVISLMRDLKAIGANQTAKAKRGLMGKQQLALLKHGYEPYRVNGKLAATYQVVYAVLEKH